MTDPDKKLVEIKSRYQPTILNYEMLYQTELGRFTLTDIKYLLEQVEELDALEKKANIADRIETIFRSTTLNYKCKEHEECSMFVFCPVCLGEELELKYQLQAQNALLMSVVELAKKIRANVCSLEDVLDTRDKATDEMLESFGYCSPLEQFDKLIEKLEKGDE